MRLIKKAAIAFAVASAATAVSTFAMPIGTIETTVASGTTGITTGNTGAGDPPVVITAIGSQPSSLDGYTYTNYALIGQDSTGSAEFFGHLPTGAGSTNYNVSTSTLPAVGDAITATGEWSPFDSIPELEALTALTRNSTGNTLPASPVVTVAQLSAITSTSYNVLGYLLTLNNVQFTTGAGGVFPTHANGTYTISDVGTSDSMTLFQWASSYSAAGAFGGTTVPTGTVDMTGIVDIFSGTPEFTPFSITPVPEPASLGLLGITALGLLKRRRTAR